MDDTTPDLQTFVRLETNVWDALVSGDRRADSDALHEDFIGLYPSGFANKSDHVEQLASGPTVASYELDGTRVIMISPDAALFCYRASYRRPGPEAPIEQMYVSSLWQRVAGHWVNTFSQDTPATGVHVP